MTPHISARCSTCEAEQLQAAGDPGKLRHHVAEIDDDQCEHQEERHAEPEFLADQIAQPLARHGSHAGRHLLHDDQRDRDRESWSTAASSRTALRPRNR